LLKIRKILMIRDKMSDNKWMEKLYRSETNMYLWAQKKG